MNRVYHEDQEFVEVNGIKKPLLAGEYEGCRFSACNLSDVELSDFHFYDCTFEACNLSNAQLHQTVFRNCRFVNCKMMGLKFETCNPFLLTVHFENCVLQYASFYQMKMKDTTFTSCNLMETDFTEADFSNASFAGSNLALAVFDHTNLEKADFRTALNYQINPLSNKIKKAKFSWPGLTGLLDYMDIEVE